MRTVGTRELKQNPNAVIQEVLAADEAIAITTHGRPTGVHLVADRTRSARWVRGHDLLGVRPSTPDDSALLKAQIDAARDDEDVEDPWEPRS
ncbi:type II toxin-antitoxin system Phd/YefM family antitoxin [Cellulomonas biazotea]|uniref:Antitoxin n=1 Tax=Cellulomonas biazotea TaxID=1709 RepID=A0A402DQZ0_9CELL|nr:type II toxin-antitoxin system Phd/YefM family antitoxin [Cellulomonas biazotea]GCE76552.1 hypothetical protein CBZ_16080 [Cellulomonas biazotea]